MIGVGVRGIKRDAVGDQLVNDPPPRVVGRHPVCTGEEQRVMGDDEVSLNQQGFVHHLDDGVNCQQNAMNRRSGFTAHQAHAVPVRGQSRRVTALDRLDRRPHCRHVLQATQHR